MTRLISLSCLFCTYSVNELPLCLNLFINLQQVIDRNKSGKIEHVYILNFSFQMGDKFYYLGQEAWL